MAQESPTCPAGSLRLTSRYSRILQSSPLSRSNSLDSHWNLCENPIHRSFFHLHDFSALSRDLPRLSFGFQGFFFPDVKSSCTLKSLISDDLLLSLAPPGYALVHVTAFHKTAALYSFSSGFRTFKCQNALVLRICDLPNPDVLFTH
jgi:hypothetical protein